MGGRSSGPRRYRVHEVLGQGGFGTVYRADLIGEDGFQKEVALKLPTRAGPDRAQLTARLRDEARMLGLVRHRALVGVDALIRLDGLPCIVMERVDGVSLDDLLEHAGPLPPAAALEVAAEIAAALHAAWHTEVDGRPLRLLHRDVKPANVLLGPTGDVKLLDFGVARAEFERREARTREVVFGSPAYMSPERLELEDTAAGDVFALGITLAEIASGERAGPVSARPSQHAERVSRLVGAVPPDLRPLVERMLAYEIADRPGADAVETECRRLVEAVPGLRLREWAAARVPGATASRRRKEGELTGRILSEESDFGGGDSRATWNEFELPQLDEPPAQTRAQVPPTRVAPRPKRRWLRWVAFAIGGAGASLFVGLGLIGLLTMAGLIAVWPGVRTFACTSLVDQMETALRKVSAPPEAFATTDEARRGCLRGDLGVIGADVLLIQVQQHTADGSFDATDRADLEKTLDRWLP